MIFARKLLRKFDFIELQVIINRDTLVKLLAKHTENVRMAIEFLVVVNLQVVCEASIQPFSLL